MDLKPSHLQLLHAPLGNAPSNFAGAAAPGAVAAGGGPLNVALFAGGDAAGGGPLNVAVFAGGGTFSVALVLVGDDGGLL